MYEFLSTDCHTLARASPMIECSSSKHRWSTVSANSFTERVVCPRKMRGKVFTTAAVDNIDHKPCATTSNDSFHGTAVSLIQHPSYTGEGVDQNIIIVSGSGDARSKTVAPLPHYYTDGPPVTSSIKNSPVPAATVASLTRGDFKQQTHEECQWLGNAKRAVEDNTSTVDNDNTSWTAFHAS